MLLTSLININENIANILAILCAILFAYYTNKDLVFKSKAQTISQKISEFIKFISGRLITMILEILGFYLLFNIFGIHKLISKTLITILVILLNYFISKFFTFKEKK